MGLSLKENQIKCNIACLQSRSSTEVIKEIPKIPKDYCRRGFNSKSERGERIEKSRLTNKFPLGYQPKSNSFENSSLRQFVSFSPTITTGTHENGRRSLGLRDHNCTTLARIPSRHIEPIFSIFFLPFYFTVGKTRRDVLLCLRPVISFCISTSCSHPFSGYSVSLLCARRGNCVLT